MNNAGGQFTAPASTINGKGFRTVVELNLVGTYLMIRAAYDVWMKENGGSIVNILANFENGYVWYSHSAAARAGVANLSYSLIQEWSPRSGNSIAVSAFALALNPLLNRNQDK